MFKGQKWGRKSKRQGEWSRQKNWGWESSVSQRTKTSQGEEVVCDAATRARRAGAEQKPISMELDDLG